MYDIKRSSVAKRVEAFIAFLNQSKKDHIQDSIAKEIQYICSDGQELSSASQVKELYQRYDEFYDEPLWTAQRITVVDAHSAYVSIVFHGIDKQTLQPVALRSIQFVQFNPLGKIIRIDSDKVLAA